MGRDQRVWVPRRRVLAGAVGAAVAAPWVLDRPEAASAAVQASGSAEWVNAIAYGADPTGQADSAAAITTAMAAGPVFLPWGTYLVGSAVTVPQGGVLVSNGMALDLAQAPSYGGGAVIRPAASSMTRCMC